MQLKELVKRYQSGKGFTQDTPVGSTYSAAVFILTFNDLSRAVIKNDYSDNIDKEMQVVPFAQAFKVNIPEILRISDTTIIMQMISGDTAGGHDKRHEDYSTKFKNMTDYRRMCIMDGVIFNSDRHRYNWMIDDDEIVWAIDHNYAFSKWIRLHPYDFMHDYVLDDVYSPDEIQEIDQFIAQLSMQDKGLQSDIQNQWALIKLWDRKSMNHYRECFVGDCPICHQIQR